jgi:outer membrane protein TolC
LPSLEIVTLQYTAGTTDYLQVITSQTAALQTPSERPSIF